MFSPKKIMLHCCLLFSATSYCFANEPMNLDTLKSTLVQYQKSGQYDRDLASAADHALQYLKQRVAAHDFHGKPAIVLDIDETSLSNYADMVKLNFGGTGQEIAALEDQGHDPAIQPTLNLYRYAKSHGIAVIFLTGRFEEERRQTEMNLKNAGYVSWDQLILRNGNNRHNSATAYKSSVRQSLEQQGYDILLTMGDQTSDIAGGHADKGIKLPNPYYFIP